MVDLRALRTFVTVADLGTVSAAADELRIAQPALSRQIVALERDLGTSLFERSPGRVRLSAAGRSLLPAARDLLVRAGQFRDRAASEAAGRLTRLTLAAPATTLADVVAPFVATFAPEDPVPTVLESSAVPSPDGLTALDRGADLVIGPVPPRPPAQGRAVAVLPVWADVPSTHPVLAGSVTGPGRVLGLAVTRLLAHPLITVPPGFTARTVLDVEIQRSQHDLDNTEAAVERPTVLEASSGTVAQALAAAGRGVAVVTDDPRYGLTRRAVLDRDGRPLRFRLFASWPHDHPARADLAAMVDRLAAFLVQRYGPDTDPAAAR
ncbi:LysR family transcriptional regulator [Nakamurella leprariae]|uniref:LysR family transcriptional regulator n=1 Tax=Nakamurella leprariae TaxID=2803911 RepID=A0A938YF30_9ACTN|nr:LysR family transcriptional regulator [Nakamurella leprariae]MBM9469532.1 LysR family transcriptional regulator [Nakamurella leprariae]